MVTQLECVMLGVETIGLAGLESTIAASLVQDQNGNFYYVSRQANMVEAKRQKTLQPTSTPSLLHAKKLSAQPLPVPLPLLGERSLTQQFRSTRES